MSLLSPMKFGDRPVTAWTPSQIEFILFVVTWPIGLPLWIICSLVRKRWFDPELTVQK